MQNILKISVKKSPQESPLSPNSPYMEISKSPPFPLNIIIFSSFFLLFELNKIKGILTREFGIKWFLRRLDFHFTFYNERLTAHSDCQSGALQKQCVYNTTSTSKQTPSKSDIDAIFICNLTNVK